MKNLNHLEEFIYEHYPFWKKVFKSYPIKGDLLFGQSIPLKQQTFKKCHLIIKAFWQLRQNIAYQNHIKKTNYSIDCCPSNYSILMCYDFHITDESVKLIEINTNASFGIVAGVLSHINKQALPFKLPIKDYDGHEFLKKAIKEEIDLCKLDLEDINIAIIDDHPEKQKTYFEFPYYKALFEHWGYNTIICDPSELEWDLKHKVLKHNLGQTIHFVYNRCCDFLLENPKNKHLKQAFIHHKTCFSPNPYEYCLLAHKQRLIECSNKSFLESLNLSNDGLQIIKESVPFSSSILDVPKEELWSKRKKLFFKPKTLYGGKGVFRGASISRKKLESIYNDAYMAQEYIPAPMFKDYKYDLRVYTYKSEPYLALARLYRGQVTNANTVGGGLASIDWTTA